MRLSLRAEETELDVAVAAAHESVTVADLFGAAGLTCDPTVPVDADGYRCDPSTPLAALDLSDGAVIISPHRAPERNGTKGREPIAELVCIAGPQAGRRRPLEVGIYDLCLLAPERARSNSTGVFRLEVLPDGGIQVAGLAGTEVIVDGRSTGEDFTSGRWISVDGYVFRVTPIPPASARPASSSGGRTAFVRPPRVIEAVDPDPVVAPTPPPEPRKPEALSFLLLLLPIPIGIVMAFFLSPFFLMFTLMSPIMAVARHYDGKRKARRGSAERSEIMATDLAQFADQLDRRRQEEADRARRARPDLARMAEMARLGDPELWRSRSTHDDFLRPVVGVGPTRWAPAVLGDPATPELQATVAEASILPMTPVTVDLFVGPAVGIVGPVEARRRLAAALVAQLAVEHGPGDVELAAFLTLESARFWDHLKWLPHLTDESGGLRVATTVEEADRLADRTMPEPDRTVFRPRDEELVTPVPVFLVDGDEIVRSGVRPLASRLPRLTGRALVLADSVDELPAFCTSYVQIGRPSNGDHHLIELVDVGTGRSTPSIVGAFADLEVVAGLSRSLARFTDPDAPGAGASLPERARLKDVLGIDHEPDSIRQAWEDPPSGCRSTLGVGEQGALHVELLRDGPHALVAGTTGAGKSELLRSMIVSLAAHYGPDQVTFVLIDFKGGGAFDVFADLPHNVGVVTDLDEHLAGRALRCLQAELKYREHRLREVGVSDLRDYPAGGEPLPRLLIIVDEFATLAAELPEFLASLVDVAQRGRSLGIHMVLATQRPTGVVDGKIRANTNLRIALRVQDDGDSIDVIGTKAAAGIDRRHPGRAFARFGAGDVVGFQTALVTVRSETGSGPALHLDLFDLLGQLADEPDDDDGDGGDGPDDGVEAPDDLARYVGAARSAATELGLPEPRVPWPDPLPSALSAEELLASAEASGTPAAPWATPFGLVDLPDLQRQDPAWWAAEDGNVIVYGIEPGAAASVVSTIVLGLAKRHSSDEFHAYLIDFAGSLAALRQLPHAGGYVSSDDDERLLRTIQLIEDELDRRRRLVEEAQIERIDPEVDLPQPTALTGLIIANYAAVLERLEELGELTGPTRLAQIVRDGPGLGVFTFVAASSERDVPSRVAQQVEARLLLRLADPNAYMMFGLKPKEIPELGRGRIIDVRTRNEIQVASFEGEDLRATVENGTWPVGTSGPAEVSVLGADIGFARVADHSSADGSVWKLAVGIGHGDLEPVTLDLRLGRHLMITGPSGSGKTSTLQTLAAAARAADPEAVIAVESARPEEWEPVTGGLGLTTLEYLLSPESETQAGRRALIIIDGIESVRVPTEILDRLTAQPVEGMHLAICGRYESFRTPDPWVRAVSSHRTGVALAATAEHGELFRCRFPNPKGSVPEGRGYVINEGLPVLAQVAHYSATPVGAGH